MDEEEAPWSVAKHKGTDMPQDGAEHVTAAAPQPTQPRCGGGSRHVLLGWDTFRSRMLLGLLLATVVWAAVYFPLISLT